MQLHSVLGITHLAVLVRERESSKTLHQVSQGQNKREENIIDRQAQILVYFCVMP